MCGICGVMNIGTVADGGEPETLDRMSSALRHRGPDDSGHWHDERAWLGHRRLSIIDVEKSAQPMVSADQRFVLVFNGEVLNYRKLRNTLDYPFVTAGDTEAILAAHSRHGDAAVSRLEGQFAYGLYDRDDGSLLLARDRMGIVPLYWWSDGSRFLFASELTALLRGVPRPVSLSTGAIGKYLRSRSVAAPDTLVDGLHKVRPGHLLRVTPTGVIREEQYWWPSVQPTRLAPGDAVEELDRRLGTAVESAMVADVPVGAYLSGGVDSSLIVAKAAAVAGAPLHTFSAGFGDERTDETSYARLVSSWCGTRHHGVQVRPADFFELWPTLSRHRGAPLSEPADIAVYRLAQCARQHVKVVLSGEGSDELFAGYPKYRLAGLTRAVGLLPASVRTPLLSSAAARLPASGRRLGVALRALSEPGIEDRVTGWFAPFTDAERRALIGVESPKPSRHGHQSSLRLMLERDQHQWLSDNLLERGDRMTMAGSVEMRPPFLDMGVVNFSLGLPDHLLVRRRTGKWLVKQVATRYLPQSVVGRRKAGFKVPLDTWFRHDLRDFVWDLVSSGESVTQTYLDAEAVSSLFRRHDERVADESIRIWTIASLEVWYRTLLEDQAG